MDAAALDELAELRAEPVVGVGRDVVKLVHRDQAVVERFDPEPLHGEAERGVGAHQHAVLGAQEPPQRAHLPVIPAGRVAEVPARRDRPVTPEAVRRQRLVGEAGADGALGHDDDGLPQPLVRQLVEGDEHQGAALAGSGGRLNQEVLLAAPRVGTRLHGAHAEFVGCVRGPGTGVGDRDAGNGLVSDKILALFASRIAPSCMRLSFLRISHFLLAISEILYGIPVVVL